MKKLFLLLIGSLLILSVVSCSSTGTQYKGAYAPNTELQPIEVPPDLDKPVETKNTEIPESARSVLTIKNFQQSQSLDTSSRVAQLTTSARFVRDGSIFWLEIKDKPDTVWHDLRDFFQKVGFDIKLEKPEIGVMETNWLENKLEIPQNWLSRLFKNLFSTGLLDRYRARVEQGADQNTTLVFISHQGLKEVTEGDQEVNFLNRDPYAKSYWGFRQADPELEAEMLMRFMAYRGQDEQAAKLAVEGVVKQERTKLLEQNGTLTLQVNDTFSRSWRHVELAMDRLGFVIEDRNRSTGIYFIQLPDTFRIPGQGGFFSSNEIKPSTFKFNLAVEAKGDVSLVSLSAREGKPEDLQKVAKKVLDLVQQNIL